MLLPGSVTIYARYTRTAGIFADDGNQFPLGERSSVDARIAKRLSRVTVRVGLLNVTNDRYEEVRVAKDGTSSVLLDKGLEAPVTGIAVREGLRVEHGSVVNGPSTVRSEI